MQYINHVTLNTGHTRKSYPNEVNKEIYFILNRIYKDSFKNNGAKFKEYTIKGTPFDSGAIFTVYKDSVPIMTTASTRNQNSELWKMLLETSTITINKKLAEPIAPYIVDRIEIGLVFDLQASSWTGDFSKCMGWITLFPEKIR